jgi:dihydroorotate dehydrogenase
VIPSWFTLNLSCPNTEDDPRGNQTAQKAHDLCGALVDAAGDVPLWVKVGPCLSDAQYAALMGAFAETGVRAVIATNTLPAPTPDGSATAGVGGGRLREPATAAVQALVEAKGDTPVDVIACGGVLDGETYRTYRNMGAGAVQYYSALIYRSPLAAAIMHWESTHHERP